ncbi:hypothetical protein VTO42DRAFT_7437 [Malbranchea cinnamomea]
MFEGFSFQSPSSRRKPGLQVDHDGDLAIPCDSTMVSPLSSRCPSPAPVSPSSTDCPDCPRFSSKRNNLRSQFHHYHHHHHRPAPTSTPSSHVEERHRLSIGSLTHRLRAQKLEGNETQDNNSSSGSGSGSRSRNHTESGPGIFTARPRSSSHAESEDVDMPPAAQYPIITATQWPDHRSPEPLTPEDTDRDDDPACIPRDIRQHRETLSILQSTACNISDTLRLAGLLGDADRMRFDDKFVDQSQHPSSIPPLRTPSRRRPQVARNPSWSAAPTSSSSASSQLSTLGPNSRRSKIDKSHYPCPSITSGATSGGTTSLFSSQDQGLGLRRKSLVLAAVSAALEAESAAAKQRKVSLVASSSSSSPSGLLTPRSSPDVQVQSRRCSRSLPP